MEWRDALGASRASCSWKIFGKYVSIHSSRITTRGGKLTPGKKYPGKLSCHVFQRSLSRQRDTLAPRPFAFATRAFFISRANVPMLVGHRYDVFRSDVSPFLSFLFSSPSNDGESRIAFLARECKSRDTRKKDRFDACLFILFTAIVYDLKYKIVFFPFFLVN